MAKIPRYQQGQLASAQVGTPGVDAAALDTAHGMASAVSNLTQANTVINTRARAQLQQVQQNAFENLGFELRLMRAHNRQAAEEQRRLQEDELTAHHDHAVSMAINDLRNNVFQEYAESPQYAPGVFRQRAEDMVSRYLRDNNLSQKMRTQLTKSGLSSIESSSEKMDSWALTQGNDIAKRQLDNDMLDLENGAANLQGDLSVFENELMPFFSKSADRFNRLYGASASSKFQNTQEKLVKQFIEGGMQAGRVQDMKTLLTSGHFGHVLEAADTKTLLSRTNELLDEQDRDAARAHEIAALPRKMDARHIFDEANHSGDLAAMNKSIYELEKIYKSEDSAAALIQNRLKSDTSRAAKAELRAQLEVISDLGNKIASLKEQRVSYNRHAETEAKADAREAQRLRREQQTQIHADWVDTRNSPEATQMLVNLEEALTRTKRLDPDYRGALKARGGSARELKLGTQDILDLQHAYQALERAEPYLNEPTKPKSQRYLAAKGLLQERLKLATQQPEFAGTQTGKFMNKLYERMIGGAPGIIHAAQNPAGSSARRLSIDETYAVNIAAGVKAYKDRYGKDPDDKTLTFIQEKVKAAMAKPGR